MITTIKALYMGKPVVWQVADITRFESSHKYTVAYRNDGKELLIDESLRKLAVDLGDRFIQINRAALVSRDALVSVQSRSHLMEGFAVIAGVPEPMPCSRKYVSAVKQFIRQRNEEAESH